MSLSVIFSIKTTNKVFITLAVALFSSCLMAGNTKKLPPSSVKPRIISSAVTAAKKVHSTKVLPQKAQNFARIKTNSVAKVPSVIIKRDRVPVRLSFGQMAGLSATTDFLGLESNAALVLDYSSNEVLLDKNSSTVLPIASLTKLMTALVIADEGLPLDEPVGITEDDIDLLKGSGSRLAVGTVLTRYEMLHLALMSSENRAAHALGREFPGGIKRFVEVMNAKAKLIGMSDTKYVDPTGLSPLNQSSARDLSRLVAAASDRPIIRSLSTSPSYSVDNGQRLIQFRNSNQLVSNPTWEIGLQKTGYISEAGRCLVMLTTVAGRQVIMVFLDSANKLARVADAERVKKWVETLR